MASKTTIGHLVVVATACMTSLCWWFVKCMRQRTPLSVAWLGPDPMPKFYGIPFFGMLVAALNTAHHPDFWRAVRYFDPRLARRRRLVQAVVLMLSLLAFCALYGFVVVCLETRVDPQYVRRSIVVCCVCIQLMSVAYIAISCLSAQTGGGGGFSRARMASTPTGGAAPVM